MIFDIFLVKYADSCETGGGDTSTIKFGKFVDLKDFMESLGELYPDLQICRQICYNEPVDIKKANTAFEHGVLDAVEEILAPAYAHHPLCSKPCRLSGSLIRSGTCWSIWFTLTN